MPSPGRLPQCFGGNNQPQALETGNPKTLEAPLLLLLVPLRQPLESSPPKEAQKTCGHTGVGWDLDPGGGEGQGWGARAGEGREQRRTCSRARRGGGGGRRDEGLGAVSGEGGSGGLGGGGAGCSF